MLNTRLPTIDAQDRKHVRDTQDAPSGKRLEQLHLAYAVYKEAAKQYAHWRDPALKEAWGISLDASLDGVGAAVSAWTAGRCNKNPGLETLPP